MHLLIRAVSLAGQPLTQAISAYFDERGGTMGRSDTNTLSLPDPERRISRLQAEVSRNPEGWRLLNVGNANPIWHNNKAVPPGEAVQLDEGDELQVGTYSLRVSLSTNDPAAHTITQGRAAVDSRTVIVGSGTETRTDPSRMAAPFSVNLVSAPQAASGAVLPPDPSSSPKPREVDSGATQLVTDPGRVGITQARPLPPAATVMAPAPAPAATPMSPAAAPSASSFDDLLGSAPAVGAPPAAAAASGAGRASPFDDLFAAPLSAPPGAPPGAPASTPPAAAPLTASTAEASASLFDAPLTAPLTAPLSTPPADGKASDPFADLLGPGGGGLGTGLSAFGGSPAAGQRASSAPSQLPEDFDPFADLSPARPAAGVASASPGAGAASPFDGFGLGLGSAAPASAGGNLQGLDFMGGQGGGAQGGTASSIDQLFGLSGARSAVDPLAGFLAQTAPAAPQVAAVGAPSSIDPLALLSPAPAPSQAAPPAHLSTLADDVPEVHGLMPLPAAFDAMVSPPVSAPARAPAAHATLPDDTTFDDLISGLVPTQPAPLSVQPVELPALAAQTPRTPLRGAPLLVASSHGDAAPEANPLMALSGGIALAEPAPVQSLVPHQVTHGEDDADAQSTSPGGLDELLGGLGGSGPATAMTSMPAAAPAAPAAPAQPGVHADHLALWSAFCQGAGVHFTPPQGLNPDLMRVIGRLLRNAVDGSVKLVAARAATKQALRAEVTVIQAKGNNPLKFSPDTESALEQLLQPPLRGFMPGPDAVADAMDDLLGHTIGTMVGTRAALEGVLKRFEPEQLEAKLAGRSVMDSLLPMNRRAKLWELYLQHHESVRTEAQEDFHNLFGKAFLQAYEEQLDRLDAERRAVKSTRSA